MSSVFSSIKKKITIAQKILLLFIYVSTYNLRLQVHVFHGSSSSRGFLASIKKKITIAQKILLLFIYVSTYNLRLQVHMFHGSSSSRGFLALSNN